MTEQELRIMLEQMSVQMGQIVHYVAELRSEIRATADTLRDELRSEIRESADTLRDELRSEIRESADNLRLEFKEDLREEGERLEHKFDHFVRAVSAEKNLLREDLADAIYDQQREQTMSNQRFTRIEARLTKLETAVFPGNTSSDDGQ